MDRYFSRRILKEVVGHQILRALDEQRTLERHHMMTFVQILEIGRLAMNLPRLAEIELVNSVVRQLGIKIVDTAVALNWTVVYFVQLLNALHHPSGSILTVNQDC